MAVPFLQPSFQGLFFLALKAEVPTFHSGSIFLCSFRLKNQKLGDKDDTKEMIVYCLSKPGTFLDYPFGPETAVIKVKAEHSAARIFCAVFQPEGPSKSHLLLRQGNR